MHERAAARPEHVRAGQRSHEPTVHDDQGELVEALGALAASRPERAVHERFVQQRARLVGRIATELIER